MRFNIKKEYPVGSEAGYHGRECYVVAYSKGAVILSFPDTGEEEEVDLAEFKEQNI